MNTELTRVGLPPIHENKKKKNNINNVVVVPVEEEETTATAVLSTTTWESCCLRVDRALFMFVAQYFMGFSVLGFCAFQLVRSEFACDRGGPYWAAISMILGVFLGRSSTAQKKNT